MSRENLYKKEVYTEKKLHRKEAIQSADCMGKRLHVYMKKRLHKDVIIPGKNIIKEKTTWKRKL